MKPKDLSLLRLSYRHGPNKQKNSKKKYKKITNIAKRQISEAIKIISYYLNNMYFFTVFNHFNSANFLLKD